MQVLRKLHRDLGIRLDYEEAEKLFLRRLDDPAIHISRGFEANFDEPTTEQGRRIKGAIDEHRDRTASKLERELFSQKTRLVNAERALTVKETKRARDNRIFPMVYAGVIIRREGANLLTPMRYACRPAGKPAFYDKKFPGLYSARRDNLERFWNEQFGRHHALMVADSFYENVALHIKEHRDLAGGEKEQNVVLHFTPNPPQPMLIACLWSHWTDPKEPDLNGFAAITDEPPPDVAAAGHDRCIINLRQEHVEAWLTPAERSTAELHAILSDRAVSTFAHAALEAA